MKLSATHRRPRAWPGHNRLQTTEKFGFGYHKGAFPDKIEFFAHDLPVSILDIRDPAVGLARN